MRFSMNFWIPLVSIFIGISAHAATQSETDFVAATLTGEAVSDWLRGLSEAPKSLGIFSIRTNPPLDSEYSEIIHSAVSSELQKDKSIRLVDCVECRIPQVVLKGDRLLIKKGAPDGDSLKDFAKKYDVQAFLVLEVYRTKLSLITQASLHQAGTGDVLYSERFRVPTLSISESSMQIVLTAGPGIPIGGKEVSSENTDLSGALNLMVLEELGFGKGGLTGGYVLGGAKGSLGYVAPTLAWRGNFSSGGVSTLLSVGAGFGYSSSTGGVAARVAYDFFIGSFTELGIEAVALVPVKSNVKNDKPISGYLGVHMGFSLGR